MKRFGYTLVSLVLALGLLFSACAAPAQPVPSKPVTPQPATEKPATAAQTLSREQQLIEAAKKEGEVSLWVHDIVDQQGIVRLFESTYPSLKLKIWNGRGGEIVAKMSEEAKAGRHSVDVVIVSSEIVDLHELGLLSEYEYPNVKGWLYQPAHNFYKAIGGTARLVPYNTNLVQPADVPKSWDDVKSTRWAGKTLVSTSGGDNPFFWAYLWRQDGKLNWDKAFAFWGDFIRNSKPRLITGFSTAVERLLAGEASLFPGVPTVLVLRNIAIGAPIAIAPLGVVSGDVAGIALVKGAPHPNAARLLLDWFTSPEGTLAYCNPTYYLVLNPQLEAKSKANNMFKSLGMGWDPIPREMMTAANLKKSSDFWMQELGIR